MHKRPARVPCVVEPNVADAGSFQHPRPPRCQRVRTQSHASLVNHVATRLVVRAEPQPIGGLYGPGGPQRRGQVVRAGVWRKQNAAARDFRAAYERISAAMPSADRGRCVEGLEL
jgi:hypothetical protein